MGSSIFAQQESGGAAGRCHNGADTVVGEGVGDWVAGSPQARTERDQEASKPAVAPGHRLCIRFGL